MCAISKFNELAQHCNAGMFLASPAKCLAMSTTPPPPTTDASILANEGAEPEKPIQTPVKEVVEPKSSYKHFFEEAAKFAGLGTLISTLIAGAVSVATIFSNFATESIKADLTRETLRQKVQLDNESAKIKHEQETNDRTDRRIDRDREFRAKYVDLALGNQLCLDFRVRIFGYLRETLPDKEKVWAEDQYQSAKRDSDKIVELENSLLEKRKSLIESHPELKKIIIQNLGLENNQIYKAMANDSEKKVWGELTRETYELNLLRAAAPPCVDSIPLRDKRSQELMPRPPSQHTAAAPHPTPPTMTASGTDARDAVPEERRKAPPSIKGGCNCSQAR